jgi:hypothetical protein
MLRRPVTGVVDELVELDVAVSVDVSVAREPSRPASTARSTTAPTIPTTRRRRRADSASWRRELS